MLQKRWRTDIRRCGALLGEIRWENWQEVIVSTIEGLLFANRQSLVIDSVAIWLAVNGFAQSRADGRKQLVKSVSSYWFVALASGGCLKSETEILQTKETDAYYRATLKKYLNP